MVFLLVIPLTNQLEANEPTKSNQGINMLKIKANNSLIIPTDEQLKEKQRNMLINHATNYDDGRKVVELLEKTRNECGFGGVKFNKLLSNSSKNHAIYLRYIKFYNPYAQFNGHTQKAMNLYDGLKKVTGKNNPFYKGVTVNERVEKSGYKNKWGESLVEVVSYVRFNSVLSKNFPEHRTKGEFAKVSYNRLLSAPYHTRVMLNPKLNKAGGFFGSYIDKELSYNAKSDSHFIVINGVLNKRINKKHKVLTYPCENSTDVPPMVDSEYPDPSSSIGVDIKRNPIGHPIYIVEQSGEKVNLKNISLVEVKSNKTLDYILLGVHNDKNKLIQDNEAFIIPTKQLKPNADYKVRFSVLTDSNITNKEFTFKTGLKQ